MPINNNNTSNLQLEFLFDLRIKGQYILRRCDEVDAVV